MPIPAGFTWDGMIHKITSKQWDAMLAVHCTAPFRLIQVHLAITPLCCIPIGDAVQSIVQRDVSLVVLPKSCIADAPLLADSSSCDEECCQ